MFSFSLLSYTSVEMLDGVFVGVGPEVVSSEKKSNVHVSVCLTVHVRVNAHVSLINSVNMHELHCAIYTCEQYLDMQYVRHPPSANRTFCPNGYC